MQKESIVGSGGGAETPAVPAINEPHSLSVGSARHGDDREEVTDVQMDRAGSVLLTRKPLAAFKPTAVSCYTRNSD